MGLGVLSVEFVWARRWLRRLRDGARSVIGSSGERGESTPERGDRDRGAA